MGNPDMETQIERAETVRAMTPHHSAAEIAQHLRVSSRTVVRYRRQVGVAQGPAPRLTDDQRARISQLLDDGCSATDAGRTVGVSRDCVTEAFPGRAWSKAQVAEYAGLRRRIAGEKYA